jgi:hypothetical protein
LKLLDVPEDVIEQYKLLDIATPDGYVYCKKSDRACTGFPEQGSLHRNS